VIASWTGRAIPQRLPAPKAVLPVSLRCARRARSHPSSSRHEHAEKESVMKQSCKQRIAGELNARLADIERLWNDHCASRESDDGSFCDYALSFEYVAASDDQREGFFRYLISWGGPSDEFRFFVNPDMSCHRIEYWYFDWFDGACRRLRGKREH
jgi:hypothetical protein